MKEIKLVSFIYIIIRLLIYVFDVSNDFSVVDAIAVMFFSLSLLIANRNNQLFFVVFLFISYVNLSIIIGEYFIPKLTAPMTEVKYVYNQAIFLLMIFMGKLLIAFKKREQENIIIIKEKNEIIFIGLIVVSMFSFIFGVNRGELSSYNVRITPLYEYSKLFLVFAFIYSNKKWHKNLLVIIVTIFIIQDFYYGGRITSLQLMILMFLMFSHKRISATKILLASILGIFLMEAIGIYRNSFDNFGLLPYIKL